MLAADWVVRRREDGACVGKLDALIEPQGVARNVGWLFFVAHWRRGFEFTRAIANNDVIRGLAHDDLELVRRAD